MGFFLVVVFFFFSFAPSPFLSCLFAPSCSLARCLVCSCVSVLPSQRLSLDVVAVPSLSPSVSPPCLLRSFLWCVCLLCACLPCACLPVVSPALCLLSCVLPGVALASPCVCPVEFAGGFALALPCSACPSCSPALPCPCPAFPVFVSCLPCPCLAPALCSSRVSFAFAVLACALSLSVPVCLCPCPLPSPRGVFRCWGLLLRLLFL